MAMIDEFERAIHIGPRVRALREAMDLSLRDLAERSGVSAPMLSQVERGETSPTLAVASRIAGGLELRLSLYIDLHLVHEVTSPQAFDGLRLAGRTVRRPTSRSRPRTTTSRPTDSTQPIADPSQRKQVETLRAQLRGVRHPLYPMGDPPGHRPRHRPEQGLTQPGMTIVCGDSHTSTHGAFGALAFGIGTARSSTCSPPRRCRSAARDDGVTVDGELPPASPPRT
jgi:homoaconitase/3-isopropylmalate dehydratase large subunit